MVSNLHRGFLHPGEFRPDLVTGRCAAGASVGHGAGLARFDHGFQSSNRGAHPAAEGSLTGRPEGRKRLEV